MDEKAALEQLQMLEQNMQSIMAQKQQFTMQQAELEVALAEISKSSSSYKIVGNIMVAAASEELHKELNAKKEVFQVRIATLEKQENKLKERASALQQDVMKSLAQAQQGASDQKSAKNHSHQ